MGDKKSMVQTAECSGTDTAMKRGGSLLLPRLLGSGLAGVCELSVFHPVDTVAKRLMTSKQQFQLAKANEILFRGQTGSLGARLSSLFPGLGFAGLYKISQRTYKFGLQPVLYEAIDQSPVGSKIQSKALKSAIAGSMLGAGEVALLPLDVLKIKAQTNPESLQKRSLATILREQSGALYRGAGWTAARNIPGSFALFGGNTLARQMMGVEQGKASIAQTFATSMCGAVASLAISQPLDVVKTRIQQVSFSDTPKGTVIVRDLIKHEGFGAFFKGFTPKVLAVGPKLVFSFTIAQQLIQFMENRI